eukprot:CAMPEP_0196819818 /NCGR_PEP_ID=MMETSP1362-20130617/72288_1 /TAXON_ID=163516 /ORGANISM="Leptocylindrus danicus, Strain CCMP1856" /LENGTH=353 /DNA_ID=CAMNT_0042198433 /DNA_START=91 /DNA_END=1152 /DNA_ORIENTATION=+
MTTSASGYQAAYVTKRAYSIFSRPRHPSPARNTLTTASSLCSHQGGSCLCSTKRDLNDVLRIAENAARKAGEIMRDTSGKIDVLKQKSSARDIVTASDIACQETINDIIRKEYPTDRFLGEESVGIGTGASVDALQQALDSCDSGDSLLWIVDPIDGTTNFQAGLPVFCASIGVVAPDKEVVVAAVYNPILDEMVTAIRGNGCFVNGRKIDTSESKPINIQDSIINVGFPVSKVETLMASSRATKALSLKVKGLRMFACASQVMSWVAQRKLNAYISWDLNSWDICAGLLLVNEAGGFVSDFNGTEATVETREMLISCQGANDNMTDVDGNEKMPMHMEVLKILEEAECLESY